MDVEVLTDQFHRTYETRTPPAVLSKKPLCLLFLLISLGAFLYTVTGNLKNVSPYCETPRVRREWRTISTPDKLGYINSIKCLQRRPSKLAVGGSLYDDFPYIHRAVGYESEYLGLYLYWDTAEI